MLAKFTPFIRTLARQLGCGVYRTENLACNLPGGI